MRRILEALLICAAVPSWSLAQIHQFKVDSQSTVVYRIKMMDVSYFQGQFDVVTGTILLDQDHPESSSVEIEIATASVHTPVPKLNEPIVRTGSNEQPATSNG